MRCVPQQLDITLQYWLVGIPPPGPPASTYIVLTDEDFWATKTAFEEEKNYRYLFNQLFYRKNKLSPVFCFPLIKRRSLYLPMWTTVRHGEQGPML